MVHRRPFEIEWRSVHAVLLIATLVRVLARHAVDDGAIAMFVWNALAVVRVGRAARIPEAIVRRRGVRSMFPRFGRLPLCLQSHATRLPEPWPEDHRWRPLEPYVLESRPWT